jgi:hypothetical protein
MIPVLQTTPVPGPSTDGFDPFLHSIEDAELASDPETVHHVLRRMTGREVMVGTLSGQVVVARLVGATTLEFDRPPPITPDEEVAVTDHRTLPDGSAQYLGFRALVGGIERTGKGWVARTFLPRQCYLHPGRSHARLDFGLEAELEIELENERVPARGVDVSPGGLGVRVPAEFGFLTGRKLRVHFRFSDQIIQVPAEVRSAVMRDEGETVRLGLQFLRYSPELEERLLSLINAQG